MNKRILIVDDREEDIKLITKLLQQAEVKFELETAESGEECLKTVQETNPDVVLLDTLMPGLDGWQTCVKLKKLPGVTSKIIMMTGNLDAVSERKSKEAGADGYCVKFADSILSALLKQIAI